MIRNLVRVTHGVLIMLLVVGGPCACFPQAAAQALTEEQYRVHIEQLNEKLDTLRTELEKSLAAIQGLRSEVQDLRQLATEHIQDEPASAQALREQVQHMREDTEVLDAEIKQHDQIKLESRSKYPVRIGGTILFTSFLHSGDADQPNLPIIAVPGQQQSPQGGFSTTSMQTLLQLEGDGPHLWGARSRGDMAVDFWGGASTGSSYAPQAGGARLRTAHVAMEWPRQAIAFSLERPLFSPEQPASWITLAEPALAWSGNMGTWLPQASYERDLLPGHRADLQAGLIDTGFPSSYGSGGSAPSASERSRQPGYETRLSSRPLLGERQVTVGISGYYQRQTYGAHTHLDAWAAAGDWDVPMLRVLDLSGQVYRGRAIGGLGAGAFKDHVTAYGAPYGLNAAGGWAQLKLTASSTLKFNLAFGVDDAFAKDLNEGDGAPAPSSDYANLARNQTGFANVAYRPKTFLLMSAEFRRIASRSIAGQTSIDNILGIATGFMF